MNRPSLRFSLKILFVSVLQLLQTHSCRGQSQLIDPSQPIMAIVGDDIILPCQLQPAEDAAALAVEWTRLDLDSINVHVRRAGQDLTHVKHPSYKGRTSLFIDELKQGNISLKLSRVKLSDGGKYRCFIPQLSKQSFVELVVGAVSPPVISLAGIDRDRGGVELQCESKGWYPQPEVFWLDSERNLLSAGPTETVRDPDGLYTVSRKVTVEKRLSNNFTCRVEQKNTNQIRETYIIVPDDFFKAQSSSSPVIIGLAVSLVVSIMSIVAVFFFVWKWKQNMIKTKSCWNETEGGGNKNLSKSDDPEMHPLNVVDTDGETFTVTTAVSEENKGEKVKKNKHLEEKQAELLKEKQDREKEVRDLKNQLESNQKQIKTLQESEKQLKAQNEEIKNKQGDLLMKLLPLHEENQRREERDLQTLKKNLETKNKELETIKPGWFAGSMKEKTAKEVETLKKDLQTKQEEFETKTKEIKEIKAELQRKETDPQRQTEETNNKEIFDKETLQDEKQRREKAEEEVKTLTEQLKKNQEIENLQKQLQESEKQLKAQNEEWERKQAELLKEKQKREEEVKDLKTQLDSKLKEIKTLQETVTKLKAQNEKGDKSPSRENSNSESTSPLKEIDDSNNQLEEKPEEDQRKTDEEEKNKERPDVNQHVNTNPAGKNSTEVFVEVDPNGKYLRLTTESKEDLKLEGWKLRVKVNDENPITYTFEKTIILRARERVTIWAHCLGPSYPLPSNLKWKDLNRLTKGDKLLVELINCDGEIVKTTERPDVNQHVNTNPACKVFMEVDPNGKYVRLTNKSKEHLKLKGWKLRVYKFNNKKPIMYTFGKSVILRAETSVNIWASGGIHSPPSDLTWKDLKCWTKGDKLLVELINCHEEIVTTIEGDTSLHGENSHSDPISPQKENDHSKQSTQV